MSSDDLEVDPEKISVKKSTHDDLEAGPERISVKKSTHNGLIIGLVAAMTVAAFLGGTHITDSTEYATQEDLQEAVSKLELRLLQDQLPVGQPEAPTHISAGDDPIIGDPDAPITIIEFSDFQCPFCARFHVETLPLILDEYIAEGKVKLVFRDFPIQSIHPNALPASLAAECADEQGRFKGMHDALFDEQRRWSNAGSADALAIFSQYASAIGLDENAFDSCMSSQRYIDEIREDLEDGRNYGVEGTPGFFIGNDQIGYTELKGAQPFESFKRVIDVQLGL